MLITTQLLCPIGAFVSRAGLAPRVYRLVPGSPAAAVLSVGDYILLVNGKAVPRSGPLTTTFKGTVAIVAWSPPPPHGPGSRARALPAKTAGLAPPVCGSAPTPAEPPQRRQTASGSAF